MNCFLNETRPCTSSGGSSSSCSNGDGGFGIKEIAAIASASAIVVVLLVALTLCICTRKCPLRPSKRSLGRRKVKVFADVEIGAPLTYETVAALLGISMLATSLATTALVRHTEPRWHLEFFWQKRLVIGKQHVPVIHCNCPCNFFIRQLSL